MIAFVKGEIDYIADNLAVIDCNGVGYGVLVSPATLARLSGIKNVKLYTYHLVKEDAATLYGFLSLEELRLFERLITVTGLGPKGAQAILSVMKPQELTLAILSEDADSLTKAQGIGKKLAQRIILELRDKLKNEDVFSAASLGAQELIPDMGSGRADAVAALTVLGYGRGEALKAVASVALENMTAEQIIKAALRRLTAV